MMKIRVQFIIGIILMIYGTACSVIKSTQNSSHPLVNEVDKGTLWVKKNYSKDKNKKEIIEVKEEKTVSIKTVEKNTEETKLPEKSNKMIESKEIKNSYVLNGEQKSLIEEAEKYIGTPYKIGGTTKAGMDCSGLVMTIYQKQGIQLPRISPDQYKFGKPLQIHEIQPGDLLFFSTPSRPNQIGHSAMCVAIEDNKIKFIHAASTGVRYDYLVPGYYLTHYKGACRILGKDISSASK